MATTTYSGHATDNSPASTDLVPFWDVAAGAAKKTTRINFIGGLLTGGGTVATGGFTLTIPKTGTAALVDKTNSFTEACSFGATATFNANLYISTGSLGIGAPTPATRLHIRENKDGDVELRVDNPSTGTRARAIVRVVSDTGHTQGGAIIKHSLAHSTFPNGFRVINNEGDLILSTDGVDVTITDAGQIGINNATPNASAILDLTSTTKALLVPRMSAVQRNNIANKVNGMVVYNTTANILECYENGSWVDL